MKIAVPLRDGYFCSHFGGAETFALYSVDEENRVVGEPQVLAPPEHGRGVFPMWLRKQGATVVLAGGMGARAADIFALKGIEVAMGVTGRNPDSLVRQYLSGTLATNPEPCHEHGFHGCGDHGGAQTGKPGGGQSAQRRSRGQGRGGRTTLSK